MEKTIAKIKRFVSLLVACVMLISVVPSVFANPAEQFSDFPTGWSRAAMEAAVDNGLLVGIGGGKIGPQQNLTRAEMAAVMVRAFGATTYADVSMYADLAQGTWYYNDVAKAVRMGALAGTSATEMSPEDYITREQVFSILSRILALSSNNTAALSKFKDAGSVSPWALNTVIPLVERGYVNGDNNGRLNPQSYITREEFAQLMYMTIRRYITQPGTYTEDMDGIVVLRCGNVTLKDMYIEGDLVVGDGAAKNLVTLENVTVNGRLLTRGGNNYLKGTEVKYGVVVLNPNGITPFRNYRTEAPFKGIIEYTIASFLTNGGPSSGGISGGESRKYDVVFKLFEDDDEAYKTIKVTHGSKISEMPDDPDVDDDIRLEDYTFNGWVDEDGEEVTANTRVYGDMVVIADLTPIEPTITVTFFKGYGDYAEEIDEVELTLNDDGEASVEADDIPDISIYSWLAFTKSDYVEYDCENDEVRVVPTFWYYKGGEWLPFDETVVLTSDTTVHLLYKQVGLSVGLPNEIFARYSSETRIVDSFISLSNSTVEQLEAARDTGNTFYEKINDTIFGLLEDKDLIDADKRIKMLHIPLPLSTALTERRIKNVVEDRIEVLIGNPDELLKWPGVTTALSNSTSVTAICNAIYATDAYNDVVDAIMDSEEFDITEENIELVRAINEELKTITFETVMDETTNESAKKIVELLGDTASDIFNEGRERYCDDLDDKIVVVEDGEEETTPSAFDLVFDPVEILANIYEKAQPKVEEKLTGMDIRYDENPYLQYLVNHDIIDRLFVEDGVATEEYTAYKFKDITDYAEYIVELEIAVNDALLWYGELSGDQFEAVYEAVFGKIYAASDKLDGLLEDFYYNDELPEKIKTVIESVQKINDIFLKFEPKLKQIIGKYLNNSIHDDVANGTLDENERVQTAIDILIGHYDPVFTVDTLFDIFYQKDDKIQEKLQTLIDSGKFDTAIDKFRNSSVGEKLGDDAIDDIVEIVENVAEYGVEYYEVDSSDIKVIEKYEIEIGDKIFTLVRSFVF